MSLGDNFYGEKFRAFPGSAKMGRGGHLEGTSKASSRNREPTRKSARK